jgi:Pyridoxamine 5'-phosphate oxidase
MTCSHANMTGVIHLNDEIGNRLSRALADGCPVIAASVDGDGRPHLSFFGTTQVYGPDQLALWVRNADAPFLQRLAGNDSLAFLYRNGTERVMYQFHGRGRPVDDEDVRARVYEQSPEVERSMDPDRRGVAVLVDLEQVRGRQQGEAFEMSR